MSTFLLASLGASSLTSGLFDDDDPKTSRMFRSFDGFHHYWHSIRSDMSRYTHCDSAKVPSHVFVKGQNETGNISEEKGDSPKASAHQAVINDKIQRRMTPIGRFSLLSETAWNPSIITVVIELQNKTNDSKFTKRDFIRLWNERNMDERHPRFHQIVDSSTQSSSRLEEFHGLYRTDISQHVSESILPMNRQGLQKVLRDMQLTQLDLSQALWNVTICNSVDKPSNVVGNSKDSVSPTLLLIRGHHVLADGASLSAAFADLYDESDELRAQVDAVFKSYYRLRQRSRSFLQKLWKQWLQFIIFFLGACLSIMYMLRLFFFQVFIDYNPWRFVKIHHDYENKKTRKNENELDVDRVISWSDVASVEQVKWVANALSHFTVDGETKTRKISVNDVFIACVTAAMAKQLDFHRQRLSLSSSLPGLSGKNEATLKHLLPKQKCIHVAVPVHLKGGVVLPNESVGNNIGALVARVPCELDDSNNENDDSVWRLHAVSREMNAMKRTPAAILGHITAKMLSFATAYRLMPLSWTSRLYAASSAGSIVVVSNNRGSPMPVHLDGHLVESAYGFVPLPPGVPVGIAIMSYAGRISCTLSAEPWAVPDGDQFMVWVLEEYLRLVNAAKAIEQQ